MMKKILLVIAALLVIAIAFLYIRTRPSGDINNYSGHFINDEATPSDSSVRITFFGVSTILFDDRKTQILIDGFFSRPSMVKALTSSIASDTSLIADVIQQYGINRLNGIFVTHSHYDHGFDAGHVSKMTGAKLYGSNSTLNIGRGAGVPESQLQLYEPNIDLQLGHFGVRVVPSKHSPGNALKDDEVEIGAPLKQPASWKAYTEGGSYDFLITHHGKKIYVKPSPNFISGALDSLSADVLLIGIPTISKHGPDWRDQFYKENVTALEPSVVIPIHWDDFFNPLSDELVMLPKFVCNAEEDFDFFLERTNSDGIEFIILQGTKSYIVN